MNEYVRVIWHLFCAAAINEKLIHTNWFERGERQKKGVEPHIVHSASESECERASASANARVSSKFHRDQCERVNGYCVNNNNNDDGDVGVGVGVVVS